MISLLVNLEYTTEDVYHLFIFSEYKLGARVEICIEPLQKEEKLG